MSLDRSLKGKSGLVRQRSVLKRSERLAILKDEDRWDDSKSVFGLPKVKVVKAKVKKTEKKTEEAAEGAAPAAAAEAAPAGKGAPAAKGAAPAAKAAAPAAKGGKK